MNAQSTLDLATHDPATPDLAAIDLLAMTDLAEFEPIEFAAIELTASDLATDEPVADEPEASAQAPVDQASVEQASAEQASVEQADANSLEAVELELALHNQNLVSLGFEESIQTALKEIGGEMLFQMRLENEDCQRVAAVRIGNDTERQFALVIMPPDGGLMRVEPVAQSTNPIAKITESYAGLMDVFRAAA
jgi:hypothetical protein